MEANLYLTSQQLRDLSNFRFEIGNHTRTHIHCRTLSSQDLYRELDANKAELETMTGLPVRSFSIPYGSSTDLTPTLLVHLRNTGHNAIFLSESVANSREGTPYSLDRVSMRADRDDRAFLELEIMPRLRTIRNRFFGGADRRPAVN